MHEKTNKHRTLFTLIPKLLPYIGLIMAVRYLIPSLIHIIKYNASDVVVYDNFSLFFAIIITVIEFFILNEMYQKIAYDKDLRIKVNEEEIENTVYKKKDNYSVADIFQIIFYTIHTIVTTKASIFYVVMVVIPLIVKLFGIPMNEIASALDMGILNVLYSIGIVIVIIMFVFLIFTTIRTLPIIIRYKIKDPETEESRGLMSLNFQLLKGLKFKVVFTYFIMGFLAVLLTTSLYVYINYSAMTNQDVFDIVGGIFGIVRPTKYSHIPYNLMLGFIRTLGTVIVYRMVARKGNLEAIKQEYEEIEAKQHQNKMKYVNYGYYNEYPKQKEDYYTNYWKNNPEYNDIDRTDEDNFRSEEDNFRSGEDNDWFGGDNDWFDDDNY